MQRNAQEHREATLARRRLLSTIGAGTATLLLGPGIHLLHASGRGCTARGSYATQVAVTQAETYERAPIKRKVQDLFDSLGGIGDVLKGGNRVAIKTNLSGGSGLAFSPRLRGVPITESMCAHPEVLRAVGELVIDCGAEASGRNPRVR